MKKKHQSLYPKTIFVSSHVELFSIQQILGSGKLKELETLI